MTIFPLIESASGMPLRSRMSPRSARSGIFAAPSAAAIAAYDCGSTPCSCTSRAPKKDRTIAMRTNPMRSRSMGAPREGPRRVRVLGTGLPHFPAPTPDCGGPDDESMGGATRIEATAPSPVSVLPALLVLVLALVRLGVPACLLVAARRLDVVGRGRRRGDLDDRRLGG